MSRSIADRWVVRTVGFHHYVPTHPHQPGSLIEISRWYAGQDKDRYSDHKMRTIRDKWIRKQKKLSDNNLSCAICGKSHLSTDGKHKENLATLDHIIPISRCYKLWNNPFNFQVVCYSCNSKKQDLTPSEFDLKYSL